MSGNVLLEARKVSVRFGGVRALEGVDFTLKERELRCLIGPNGAGKSTFFRCLTGSQILADGTITLGGKDISGKQRFQIARNGIGIKTQVPNLFDGLSVYENIWLALRASARANRRAQVGSIMERMNLTWLAGKVVGQLSHGQRQFVEIAMVIASDPKIILLDEPAAGMTKDEIRSLAEIIVALSKDHAIVVVEHDMEFIKMIGKSVVVFNQGKILAEGAIQDIMANPLVKEVYLGSSYGH